MDVRMPDGTVISNVPDGTTRAQLMQKLAGNGYDMAKMGVPLSDQIPTDGLKAPTTASSPAFKPDPSKDSFLGRIGGTLEAPISIATSIPAGIVGNIAGVGKSIINGKFGTSAGVKSAENTADDITNMLTYRPRTDTGNELLRIFGNAANVSGIIAAAPLAGEFSALGRAVPSARNAMADVAKSGVSQTGETISSGRNALAALFRDKNPAMRGGGAALTEDPLLRTQRAADLPVPINLTKGQANRTFEQQRFERETSKLPEGEPLRARFAEQNKQMIDNFDSFMDSTGSQQTSLRGSGESVVGALSGKRRSVKSEINNAYADARNSGHMAEQVDIAPIRAYIEKNRSAAKNAPILSAVDDEITRLSQGRSSISLNEMEELRKMTGRLAQPGTPNAVYGGDVKGLIDTMTKDKGGVKYQQARRMYENYANEFKDKAVIDKLLRNRPGTSDRAVAYEDVFNHSIMQGSLDDVRSMRRTLQTAGPEGQQAWRELQGQTINHIRETVTGNSARDVLGNPIVSPDKLNKLVRGLDADGKLDFIFGKKGAEKIRDINDLAKDVYTSPPGSVNSSNTSSALMAALDLSSSAFTGLPLPIATTMNYGIKRVKSNALKKKVTNALSGAEGQP